ncbi:MAG: sulfite exporter TauE/SafE family protein [Chitinophagaceae bacterium]
MEIIIYLILIGIAAGFLGGLVGIGGGVIIVPALVLLLGISQHNAQGISLAMMLFPVGILGVINYYKKGYVDFKYAGLIAIGFLLGSYIGSRFSLSLPQDTVKKIFAVVMIVLAVRMLLTGKK